jgi:putative transcriptional regulator
MEEKTTLKNRVRELRARLDMRQSDLAREVGVTRQTILAIEKGRLNPSINIALKAARVLREPVDYVFYLDHTGVDGSIENRAGAERDRHESRSTTPIWNLTQAKTDDSR